MPYGVLKVGLDPGEDNLEHGETAAQPLSGQKVTLRCNVSLLKPMVINCYILTQSFLNF